MCSLILVGAILATLGRLAFGAAASILSWFVLRLFSSGAPQQLLPPTTSPGSWKMATSTSAA
jgi:hypothetical protein